MSTPDLSTKDPLPNAFSIAVGERIRLAREARGMSQRVLSETIDRRQAAISEMENGRMEVNITTLVLLSDVLDKPLSYFIPEPWGQRMGRGDLTYDEQALLLEFRRLAGEEHRRIAIALMVAYADATQSPKP